MKPIKILIVVAVLFAVPANVISQVDLLAKKTTQEDVEQQKPRRFFTDKDRDFLQLWYYEQMLEMDLDEEGRYDYLALLEYYTYKIGRLTHPKYNYTEAEQKEEFNKLVGRINAEMKDFLSEKNYKVHQKSFGRIVEMINEKRGWQE